jgi:hypothetical protein
VAIRSVAIPLLSGGAVLLGYAAFSWLRKKGPAHELRGPTTLRDAGLTAEASESEAPESEVGPLSRRSLDAPDLLVLDLDFEDELSAHEASRDDSVAPEDIGALFLARATDALSPFGGGLERRHFDLDQFDLETSPLSEATARAASGQASLDPNEHADHVTESERRPAPARAGGRT